MLTDSEGLDEIAQMHRLIWAFAVRICPKTRFRMVWPTYTQSEMYIREFSDNWMIFCIFLTREKTFVTSCLIFHLQKLKIFRHKKKSDIFHISAPNIDLGSRSNRLAEAVWTSTHNLWFWEQIRKIIYYHVNPSLQYKRGIKGIKIIYSRTSMARTPMARLPWMSRTHSWVRRDFLQIRYTDNLGRFFFFFCKCMLCALIRIASTRRL